MPTRQLRKRIDSDKSVILLLELGGLAIEAIAQGRDLTSWRIY
jgi:hypothetical protein